MSAREKLELLDPRRYPRDLRVLANQCAKLLNRDWEFKLANDFSLTEGKVDETFEKVVVTLPRGGGGAGESLHPLQVVKASAPAGTFKVRVVKGRVNAMMDADGPFSAGDDPIFTLTVANGDEVYVNVTVSYASGVWSASAFTVAKAAATPAASDTHAYYPIKDVTIASGVMSLGGGVNGNIGWRRCGDDTDYTDQWWAGP